MPQSSRKKPGNPPESVRRKLNICKFQLFKSRNTPVIFWESRAARQLNINNQHTPSMPQISSTMDESSIDNNKEYAILLYAVFLQAVFATTTINDSSSPLNQLYATFFMNDDDVQMEHPQHLHEQRMALRNAERMHSWFCRKETIHCWRRSIWVNPIFDNTL
eukprot:scaffold5385_cov72-Cylindrotheca_fusiformis.AAC.1